MALGAHLAETESSRFSLAWANDIDENACRTFRRNLSIDEDAVICGDVSRVNFDDLPDIDGLAFGFPCNDFSVVGDRNGITGRYGEMYRWGIRGLETKKPLFFVAENVSGLASSGNALEVIQREMCRAGYDIFPRLYRFEEYGVPQARRRIIIVGFRKDLGVANFQHPEPTTRDAPVSCREALRGLAANSPNNERTNQSPTVVERLKHIKPGENAFTATLPKHLRLVMNSGAAISQVYRRLEPDKPAYTVTGSGGGGTHVYHWSEPRALTNRERARLQSFPDSFVFLGGKESVRKQIGMAVPPVGARHVFQAVLEVLNSRRC